jgi:hypothetical protein
LNIPVKLSSVRVLITPFPLRYLVNLSRDKVRPVSSSSVSDQDIVH